MQYFIHHNNEQLGPFTETEVKAKLASGDLSPDDHVWWQGASGWVPLSQTALAAGPTTPAPTMPVVPGTAAAAAYTPASTKRTSQLAVWSLVCGCLSLVCGLFLSLFGLIVSVPAIILGHLGLGATKKDPNLQGRGMAIAGLVLGYVATLGIVIIVVAAMTMLTGNKQLRDMLNTIKQVQATNGTVTPSMLIPDNSTNNSSDQSTNAAPASSNSDTNSPTTNAAPASQ